LERARTALREGGLWEGQSKKKKAEKSRRINCKKNNDENTRKRNEKDIKNVEKKKIKISFCNIAELAMMHNSRSISRT